MGRRRKSVDLEQPSIDKASNPSSGVGSLVLRRSHRIKSLALPTNNLDLEPVMEYANLVEVETETEPEIQQTRVPPEVNGINLEKVDYLNGAAYDLKSKAPGRQDEGSSPEISYKSMYIDSQKKIEALIEENYNLVRQLEFAQGKISAYEEMKDVVVAPKEVIVFSAARLSPQAAEKTVMPPPKPRKTYKKLTRQHGSGNDPEPKKTNKVVKR